MGKAKEVLEIIINDTPRCAGANPPGPNIRHTGGGKNHISASIRKICKKARDKDAVYKDERM